MTIVITLVSLFVLAVLSGYLIENLLLGDPVDMGQPMESNNDWIYAETVKPSPGGDAIYEPLYSFAALADIHLQYEGGADDYARALTYLRDQVDFTCVAGDLVAYASKEYMEQYRQCVEANAGDMPVYECAGNHETYPAQGQAAKLDEALWTATTGDPVNYTFTVGGDVFIMFSLRSESAAEAFTNADLIWLRDTLEANKNKRCFLFQHVPALTDNTADPSGSWSGIMDGEAGAVFLSLIRQYPNVVWFHGHTHLTLADQTPPVSDLDYRSVHVPSLASPRFHNQEAGILEDYFYDEAGNQIWGSTMAEGFIVDVYPNKIVIRGINFAAGLHQDKVEPIAGEVYALSTVLVVYEPDGAN